MARRWVQFLLLAVLTSGCAKGPDVAPVSGVATRGGEPVANVVLWFTPTTGRPSWALTDAEGRFTLDYNRERQGAKVGKHLVTVVYEPRPSSPAEEALILTGKKKAPSKPAEMNEILAKYGPGASALEVEITGPVSDLEIKLD
jgi:hypothetical protein